MRLQSQSIDAFVPHIMRIREIVFSKDFFGILETITTDASETLDMLVLWGHEGGQRTRGNLDGVMALLDGFGRLGNYSGAMKTLFKSNSIFLESYDSFISPFIIHRY